MGGVVSSRCSITSAWKIKFLKTRGVFERYAIVSQTDVRDAMTKLEAGQQRDITSAREQKSSVFQFGRRLGRVAQITAEIDNSSQPASSHLN